MLISLTLLLVWTSSIEVKGDTYPAWPNSFKWVDGMFTMLKSQANGYKCAAFKEPKDAPWYDNFLCWKGDMAPNIKFSASGPIKNSRCTLLNEPADPNGWDNNYLCVPKDSPYHFTWSYQGKEDGLDCLKIKENNDKHGWNDNYLCGSQDNLVVDLSFVKTSLDGLNEEGMDDLGSQWESAEQDCLNNGNCNSQLSTYERDMQQVANGFLAGKEITAGISGVMENGKFSQFASKLNKFAPFLGAFGSMVSIVSLFGASEEEQRLEEVMKVLNAGFNRMEYRFDRIKDQLADLERTITEEHFWTRLTPRLEDLNSVKQHTLHTLRHLL